MKQSENRARFCFANFFDLNSGFKLRFCALFSSIFGLYPGFDLDFRVFLFKLGPSSRLSFSSIPTLLYLSLLLVNKKVIYMQTLQKQVVLYCVLKLAIPCLGGCTPKARKKSKIQTAFELKIEKSATINCCNKQP